MGSRGGRHADKPQQRPGALKSTFILPGDAAVRYIQAAGTTPRRTTGDTVWGREDRPARPVCQSDAMRGGRRHQASSRVPSPQRPGPCSARGDAAQVQPPLSMPGSWPAAPCRHQAGASPWPGTVGGWQGPRVLSQAGLLLAAPCSSCLRSAVPCAWPAPKGAARQDRRGWSSSGSQHVAAGWPLGRRQGGFAASGKLGEEAGGSGALTGPRTKMSCQREVLGRAGEQLGTK